MNREKLERILETGSVCIYDGVVVSEFDNESDSIWCDCEVVKFDDIDFDYFFEYSVEEEYGFEDNLKDIIKDLNKCLKDREKLQQGKSCYVIVNESSFEILNESSIEELFSFEALQNVIYDLKVCKFKICKGV